MHPRISVSGICSIRNTLDQDLALWERHGITNIGLPLRKLRDPGDAQRVADAGLVVTNLLCHGTALDDRSGWPAYVDAMGAAFEAARTCEAHSVVVLTGRAGTLTWEEAATAWRELLTLLPPAPARLLVEHTHALRADVGFVHTLRDVVDLARLAGVGVLAEVQACWAERGLAHTLHDGVDVIGLVQLSDYRIGTTSTPDRLVPGDGDLPLGRFVGELLAAGYQGFFDIELVGPRIEEEGYDRAVPRAVAAVTALLDELR
jgi:sugar phosphate isomerase/epimerase